MDLIDFSKTINCDMSQYITLFFKENYALYVILKPYEVVSINVDIDGNIVFMIVLKEQSSESIIEQINACRVTAYGITCRANSEFCSKTKKLLVNLTPVSNNQ